MISKKQLQVDYKGPILPEPVNITNECECDVYVFSYDVYMHYSSNTSHNNRSVATVRVHFEVKLSL